ncbi:MAG: hypothetical protein KGV44_04310 [Flavobacteriaceae bacterium]|nr:hypothetical protein [Flavobacteriaceae bacterium]
MKKKVMSGMLMVLAMMMVFGQTSCRSSKKKPKILIEKMEEIKNLHKKIHTEVSKFKKKVSSNKEVKKYVKEADKCLVYGTKIFNDTELKMSDKERLDILDKSLNKLKELGAKIQGIKIQSSYVELKKEMAREEVRKAEERRKREEAHLEKIRNMKFD